ncbi:MAG TPA: hypothetical protein VN944_04470 [Nitrospiria bacterium]|nr:hypothetical protein [Nitrospiria bacterium]
MADLKRWFKVWTAILSDDDFDPSRPGTLESIGRFSLLGAYMALHGERGVVDIMPDTLFRLMQVKNLDELRSQMTLKNIVFEEGKNRYGKITVTWGKWSKFQEDSSVAERMKLLRNKRREEEIRKEEIREDGKSFVESSPELQLSRALFELIKQRNPTHKHPNFQKWAKDVDLMIRVDHRSHADIEKIIQMSQRHSFWQNVILSPKNLRNQFDKLTIESRKSEFKDRPRELVL